MTEDSVEQKPSGAGAADGLPMVVDVPVLLANLELEESPAGRGIRQKMVGRRGPVSLMVLSLDAGAGMPEHRAGGTAVIQLLTGAMTVTVEGQAVALKVGQIVTLAPGSRHSVTAVEPCRILVTLVATGAP